MTRPGDEDLLAFLEGTLDAERRAGLLEQIERDPQLAAELRAAAVGLTAIESLQRPPASGIDPAGARGPRRVSPWWAAAAAAAALLVAVPATLWLASSRESPASEATQPRPAQAPRPEPGYVLVLQGRWPDASTVDDVETRRRAEEYWSWTSSLADAALLMAAGDLRWEPGSRLGPMGAPIAVPDGVVESPDFVVGMFALRVGSYEEALAIARQCPHLRYGGSVSVRRVARGFVTVQAAGG